MIGVFLLAESRVNCEALASVFEKESGIRIIGTSIFEPSFETKAVEAGPDIVLVELQLRDGLMATHALRRRLSKIPIVALAVPEDEREIVAWAEAGASGCVARGDSIRELISVVEVVVAGNVACSRGIASTLFLHAATAASAPVEAPARPRLTSREIEILHLVAAGLSNKQIARTLFVQVPTVKNHIHRIFEKLGVHSRIDAVAWAAHYQRPRRAPGEAIPVLIGPTRPRETVYARAASA
jgi:DNA-binding NarL/FixJ family response regulator